MTTEEKLKLLILEKIEEQITSATYLMNKMKMDSTNIDVAYYKSTANKELKRLRELEKENK